MGGTTFEGLYAGTDPKETFGRAVSEAAHENGHGGYTGSLAEKHSFVIIQHQPLTPKAAYALAGKLISDGDPRIDDKWGDAGAIPVVTGKREATLTELSGSIEEWRDKDKQIALATTAAREQKVLRRGETIRSVSLVTYQPTGSNGGYGHTARRTFVKGQARVAINKPGGPYEREVAVKIEFPGVISWQNQAEWGPLVDAKVKLKDGERIISRQLRNSFGSVMTGDTKPAPPVTKVVAEATKGKTETRYFLGGVHGGKSWAQGYESQAAARAAAVALASKPTTFADGGVLRIEIEAVTRRAGGEPLVVVERRIVKATAEVTVTVAKSPEGTADAWLFFGWASS